MKHLNIFRDFLVDTVNLNQTRLDNLNSSASALQNWLRESSWEPKIIRFEEQGSWAHSTIIKPPDRGEFDADLLVIVKPIEGWSAADYIKTLGKIFSESGLYGEKSKTWDYCVTITYSGDRKVDIAPCVAGRLWQDSMEVCDGSRDDFERSEPTKYTNWLRERNSYSGNNSFRKTTRLLKYLRDIKGTFTCSSVLFTTLLGLQINWNERDSDDFADTPTTLKTIMGRLDSWLQQHPSKPSVWNPVLPSEDFARVWSDTQYANFRSFIHKYREWIDEAYEEEDRSKSITAWRRVFGEEFARGEVLDRTARFAEGSSLVKSLLMSTAAHLDTLVDSVKEFGLSILPSGFYSIPHLQDPPWPGAGTVSDNVQIAAQWQAYQSDTEARPIRDGEVLPARGGLWFEARVNGGALVPEGYRVEWRIANTGVAALARNCGRGGFYPSTTDHTRWEALEYRGVHITEAFIVRNRDNVLCGKSKPFHVVIE